MTSKVQGEGDYDSAKRYDEQTRKFVEERQAHGEEMKGSAKDAQSELTASEREALRHAKAGDEDRRDADELRKLESQRHSSQQPGPREETPQQNPQRQEPPPKNPPRR